MSGEEERAVTLPDDAIVIRFRPTEPDAVLNWAGKEHRRTGHYRLSVFADAPREGEDEDAVIARLLVASELAGIDPQRNRKLFVCTRASKLADLGFTFHKDEEDDEVSEHYSVDLGLSPNLDDAVRFLSPFEPVERRHR